MASAGTGRVATRAASAGGAPQGKKPAQPMYKLSALDVSRAAHTVLAASLKTQTLLEDVAQQLITAVGASALAGLEHLTLAEKLTILQSIVQLKQQNAAVLLPLLKALCPPVASGRARTEDDGLLEGEPDEEEDHPSADGWGGEEEADADQDDEDGRQSDLPASGTPATTSR